MMVAAPKTCGALPLVLVLISGAGRCQQSPPVTLQVAPRDLAITPGERRRVLVIATVAGQAVHKLKLAAWPEPGTHVVIGNTAELPEEVRGDVSWPVWISRTADGKTSARIVFEAQYEVGDQKIPGLAQVAFDVSIKQRPKNEDIATATVQTAIDKLEERRPQDVFLVLTNNTDVPLEVTEVRVNLPWFARIAVGGLDAIPVAESNALPGARADVIPAAKTSIVYSSAGSAKRLAIPPRQVHVFSVTLKIPDYTAVRSGKYLMLFEVRLRYAKDSYHTESSIIASQEFQAAVLGEQEFVGVTSMPFLLLPGFLTVTFLGLLLGKVWPKWQIEPNFKSPAYYLVGVVVSLILVHLYGPLSPWLYQELWRMPVAERDLFVGFSLEDIINTWVLATAVAVVPWMLVGGVIWLFAWLRARALKDQTPTLHDRPLDVLLRLQRAHKGFSLSQAVFGGTRLWELPLPSPDPAKKWLSRRIRVTFQEPNGQPAQDLRELLNHPSRTDDLLRLVRGSGNGVSLMWQPEDRPPELVEKKDAPTVTGTPDDFVVCEA